MLIAPNSALRRQRRRLAILAATLALAGAVATAHSAMAGDRMSHGIAMCLVVAETAVVAVGAAITLTALARRPSWPLPAPTLLELPYMPAPMSVPARAGPLRLQVFRL